jgi:AcrR family transcriptional regulator
MARVSQEHLDARRRQILDAARRCFAANGFHNTSMQDVLKEAGLSAGAVYRYFPSKDALISAAAEEALALIAGAFAEVMEQQPPPAPDELFTSIIRTLEKLEGPQHAGRIAIQAWAEALRSEEMAARLRPNVQQARRTLAALVARYQESGDITADADPLEVAAVLLSVIPGFLVQHVVIGDTEADAFVRGLRALFPMLSIRNDRPEAAERTGNRAPASTG